MESRFSRAIKTVTCPKCGAQPRQGCTVKYGHPATSCHNERLRAYRVFETTTTQGADHAKS